MKIPLNLKLCLVFAVLSFFNVSVFANDIETYIQEARMKAKDGDLESAALLYKKVLEKEPNHLAARKELASVLIESQVQDPYSEQSDALSSILK